MAIILGVGASACSTSLPPALDGFAADTPDLRHVDCVAQLDGAAVVTQRVPCEAVGFSGQGMYQGVYTIQIMAPTVWSAAVNATFARTAPWSAGQDYTQADFEDGSGIAVTLNIGGEAKQAYFEANKGGPEVPNINATLETVDFTPLGVGDGLGNHGHIHGVAPLWLDESRTIPPGSTVGVTVDF